MADENEVKREDWTKFDTKGETRLEGLVENIQNCDFQSVLWFQCAISLAKTHDMFWDGCWFFERLLGTTEAQIGSTMGKKLG